ncbi:MAG TPA: pyridoxamine 5'-phosphate oxidase family protein [Candidatus Krumholzibacteria bacterium]|nr:pyridoxamine 5'-phosphate oxidase family protein [Candidatus Krumholzibacteria bacterium]HPD71930.1 pyridoxamine 5'-phosphate oxidase family protein [Candidatus Krumholzibacteria bacterium]HRY41137.1 pyridoxamine 5'-phosphate oxidase family protein [Candidatus Krumholzibacteria bacterium]
MRRHELQSREPDLFQEAARCEVGYLGLVTPDGTPRVVPLNFAAVGQALYFHGALAGEKWDLLKDGARVSFMMALPYSVIPSYWTAKEYACPATHFFKSVDARGVCGPVAEPAEKARGLQALMEKYQPEGGFRTITAADPQYAKALRAVGVFRIDVESWTGKVKFGINEPARLRRVWIARLRERGQPRDLATAIEIEKQLPPG